MSMHVICDIIRSFFFPRCDGYILPRFANPLVGNSLDWPMASSGGHRQGKPTHCPPGYQQDYQGGCVELNENPCPPGQYQDRPGHCVGCPYACSHAHTPTTTHARPTTTTTTPTPTTPKPPVHCPECMRKDPLTGQCLPCCSQYQFFCPHGTFKGPEGRCIPLYPNTPAPSHRHSSASCPICSMCSECISLPILVKVKECMLNNDDPIATHSCLLATGVSADTAGNLMTARSHPGFQEMLEMS